MVIELVVEGGAGGAELLQGLQPPEGEHRLFASSGRQV
jgi:hypothetical protein